MRLTSTHVTYVSGAIARGGACGRTLDEWTVRLDARPDGAIGAFTERRNYRIAAITRDEATAKALALCRRDGFEPNLVLSCFPT